MKKSRKENKFSEDYYLRGVETGLSNYTNYRWLPELTIPMASSLKDFMNIKDGETILDYGCARGYLVKALRSLNVEAYGCDISEWAIHNCDPQVADFVGFSFDKEDGYDHIFCKDVLEHVPQEELDCLLPKLFKAANRSCFFIVPLAIVEGGSYIFPNDEKDITHIHRKTLGGWVSLLQQYADEFMVITSNVPKLKPCVKDYPGSAGFIYCGRTKNKV
jgi:SAM-dependent methyltransferase